MDSAVREHLENRLACSAEDLGKKLVTLKELLEQVSGLTHWINRHVHLIRWCEQLLAEAAVPLPLYPKSDKGVSQ